MLSPILLLVLMLAAVSPAAAAGLEEHPLTETVLVAAGWGDADDEFAPLANFGPGPRRLGPGPLAVSEDGGIFIVDLVRKHVKVFSPDGAWVRNVPIPRGIWDDMAADAGHLYFLGASQFRLTLARLALQTGEWEELEPPADRTLHVGEGGGSITGVAVFTVTEDGVFILNRKSGVSYHLATREGRSRTGCEQLETRSFGIAVPSGERILSIHRPMPTVSGGLAPRGTLWYVTADGRAGAEILSKGGFLGVDRAGRFLVSQLVIQGMDSSGYLEVYDPSGGLESRTATAHRPLVGVVNTGPHYRFSAGAVYELWVDKTAVVVSRWGDRR